MALTLDQKDNLNVGDTLIVPSFTVRVVNATGYDGCVKVEDENSKFHYIYRGQLNKPVPYENDKTYRSNLNDLYRYKAAADGVSPGTWQPLENNGTTEVGRPEVFGYPSRPLRQFTISDVELND